MNTSIAANTRNKKFVTFNQGNAWVVHQSLSTCSIPEDQQFEFVNGIYQLGKFEHDTTAKLSEVTPASGRVLLRPVGDKTAPIRKR